MAKRKLQVFDRYRYGPRSVLVRGDRFRVTGGPIYVTDGGVQIPMSERGVFVFQRYCVQGAAKWIEGYRADGGGHVVLWVGRPWRSKDIPNLRRRPYRVIGKVNNGNARRKRRTRTSTNPSTKQETSA